MCCKLQLFTCTYTSRMIRTILCDHRCTLYRPSQNGLRFMMLFVHSYMQSCINSSIHPILRSTTYCFGGEEAFWRSGIEVRSGTRADRLLIPHFFRYCTRIRFGTVRYGSLRRKLSIQASGDSAAPSTNAQPSVDSWSRLRSRLRSKS